MTNYDDEWQILNTKAPGNDFNVLPVWASGITGKGVVLADLDDGFQTDHPALSANYDTALSYDLLSGRADASGGKGDAHGTAVAGVALGTQDWGGPVGVAPDATLMGLRIALGTSKPINRDGTELAGPVIGQASPAADPNEQDAQDSYIDTTKINNAYTAVSALNRAAQSADIANNSWGPSAVIGLATYASVGNQLIGQALQNAVYTGRGGLGLNIVFSSGNAGDEGADVSFSSVNSDPRVITVGSINKDGSATLQLTHGAGLLVTAPGTQILSANRFDANADPMSGPDPQPSAFTQGTSFSAPGVSGVIALMLQANPGLGWRDVQEIIVDSAKVPVADETPLFTLNGASDWNGGGRHFSNAYGYGLPDAQVAVRLAQTWTQTLTSDNLAVMQVASDQTGKTAISGGVPGRSFTFAVSQGLRVEHLQVTIRQSEPDAGQAFLRAKNTRALLTAPDGTQSVMFFHPGANQATLDLSPGVADAATVNGQDGKPILVQDPVTGAMVPVQQTAPLDGTVNDNAFWGQNAKGTWTLTLVDDDPADSGAVSGLNMVLWGDASPVSSTLVYTPEFADVVALDPARAVVSNGGDARVTTVNAAALNGSTFIDLNGGAGTLGGTAVTIRAGLINAVGGAGASTVVGTAGANLLIAGDGDTLIDGRGGSDTIRGGRGHDTVVAQTGAAQVTTGTGGSLVFLGTSTSSVVSNGADTVNGAIGGVGGADTIFAGGGSLLVGGFGSDVTFVGGTAASTVVGGTGRVTASGGAGGGTFSGGSAGGNVLLGGTGMVTLVGGGNGDVLFAQAQQRMGAAPQQIVAGAGNETLSGAGATADTLYFAGNSGAGGVANTLVGGGAGNDVVWAGTGDMTASGGAGSDLFAFVNGRAGGRAVINGFDPAREKVALFGYGADGAAQAVASQVLNAGYGSGSAVVTLGDRTQITFANVARVDTSMFAVA